jgi:hypothetical protein
LLLQSVDRQEDGRIRLWYLFNFANAKGSRMYTTNGRQLVKPNVKMGEGMNMVTLCETLIVVNANMAHANITYAFGATNGRGAREAT